VTPEFRAFIDNELAMCKANFLYFARRYCFLQLDGGDGGYGLFVPWESQLLLLTKMASAEEHMWFRRDSGDHAFDALCYFIHKARQLGFTALVQLLLLHRALFYSGSRTITVSLDDQKTQDVHKRLSDAYDKLPYWMKVPIHRQDVERGKWLTNGSKLTLQDFSQESGLGQGEQWDNAHLTEVAAVPDEYCRVAIQNHFMPTIARSLRGMAFMESTAQGMGNWWHTVWQLVVAEGFGRWRPMFCPWYAQPTKWSRPDVPSFWSPDADTQAHAAKIALTSERWMGRVYTPTREQLYWWETERATYRDTQGLGIFYTDYPATPEESFQHSGSGAFNSEIIQLLTDRVIRKPTAYVLGSVNYESSARRLDRNVITFGDQSLIPVHMTERDEVDPRGLVLVFDPPRKDVYYSVGGDPAEGIPGWHPKTRMSTPDELGRDNAALSGWYVDPMSGLTMQAVEFAGPVTPREFALYAAVVGRWFGGLYGNERGAPLVIEIYPGPGGQTYARLAYELGYSHFFQWSTFNGSEIKFTNSFGFYSSQKSVREAWIKAKDLIEHKDTLPVRPQSPYVLYEMSYATWDPVRMRGQAMGGFHDDRISATLFALWQLHSWHLPQQAPARQVGPQPGQPVEVPADKVDFQLRDIATTVELNKAYDAWWRRSVAYGNGNGGW
jgi:hypothetical protein